MNNTKRVRPFYIKYESWMTDNQVAEALDKAVAAGAKLYEGVEDIHPEATGVCSPSGWSYFGVVKYGETMFYDNTSAFGEDAVQITLDQLDEHLSIKNESPIKEKTPMELRNVKIDLRKEDGGVDEELSRAFQEAVFESSGRWGDAGLKEFMFGNHPFLYVDTEGRMNHGELQDVFNNEPEKEITFTYERKLTWSAKPKEKETVEICGVKYYKEDVDAMLATLKPVV